MQNSYERMTQVLKRESNSLFISFPDQWMLFSVPLDPSSTDIDPQSDSLSTAKSGIARLLQSWGVRAATLSCLRRNSANASSRVRSQQCVY